MGPSRLLAKPQLALLHSKDSFIRQLAESSLIVPTSSAAVERLFSRVGFIMNGRRNLIGKRRLAVESFIGGNPELFKASGIL